MFRALCWYEIGLTHPGISPTGELAIGAATSDWGWEDTCTTIVGEELVRCKRVGKMLRWTNKRSGRKKGGKALAKPVWPLLRGRERGICYHHEKKILKKKKKRKNLASCVQAI